MDLREIIFDGITYYYYPDDIYYSEAGNKCAPAQDDGGNEFTIIWSEAGRIRDVYETD